MLFFLFPQKLSHLDGKERNDTYTDFYDKFFKEK